jgi:hypothetical protein
MPNQINATSIQDIVAKRDQAISQLNTKVDEIRDEMDKIDLAAQATGNYTAAQKTEMNDLRSLLDSTLDAKKDLLLVSLAAIDSAKDVTDLVNEVQTTNKDLTMAFNNVQNVAATIKNIAAITQKVATLVASLTSLLAVLP